jgi:hypothetical protein
MGLFFFCRGGDSRTLHGLRYAKYPEHHKNTIFLGDGPLNSPKNQNTINRIKPPRAWLVDEDTNARTKTIKECRQGSNHTKLKRLKGLQAQQAIPFLSSLYYRTTWCYRLFKSFNFVWFVP